MTCTVCGSQLTEGATKCAQCGAAVAVMSAPARGFGSSYAPPSTTPAPRHATAATSQQSRGTRTPSNPFEWYSEVMRKYATFEGRASRAEYWMFFLVNVAVMFLLGFFGATNEDISALSYVYILAVLIPSLAVGARRLHDTGRTGWLQLLGIIPIVGTLALLVLFAQPGQASANQYGPPVTAR